MSVHSSMTFTRQSTSVTLPIPDRGTLQQQTIVVQANAQAADGTVFVDDKGVTNYQVAFRLTVSPAAAALLEAFYRTTVVRALNTFTWVDHLGHAWGSCRFSTNNPDLSFVRQASGYYSVEIVLTTTGVFS